MTGHRVERTVVLAAGFLLGAMLAMCIAPGDVFLWVLTGVVLGFVCHEHFARNWGGELLWWLPHRHPHPPRTSVRPRT